MKFEFLSHHLIGGNPLDPDHGYSDSINEAEMEFLDQFENLCKLAEHKYLFVRRAPVMESHKMFDKSVVKYRMVGRFSVGVLNDNS